MTLTNDVNTVGLTAASHEKLKRLKEENVFAEMIDAYRFAIGLAIRNKVVAPEGLSCTTIYNVGSLDADGLIRDVVRGLYPDTSTPYRLAERLAEAGIEILSDLRASGRLRFAELIQAPLPTEGEPAGSDVRTVAADHSA